MMMLYSRKFIKKKKNDTDRFRLFQIAVEYSKEVRVKLSASKICENF